MKTAKKKHPPSPKLLAHLKRLNLARRKKVKPAAKKAAKAKPVARKKAAAKPAATPPKPVVVASIPPVELPKGDAPGQTLMPAVEAACEHRGVPHADIDPKPTTGEELL